MRVSKRNVEQFQIGSECVDRDTALEVYKSLASLLGVPAFRFARCGDRMSHGGHWYGRANDKYCHGRSFDAT